MDREIDAGRNRPPSAQGHGPPVLRPGAPPAPASRRRPRRRHPRRVLLGLLYGSLILMCLLLLSPYAWLLSASLKDMTQYLAAPVQWLPIPARWSNYAEVFSTYHFSRFLANSLWLAAYDAVVVTFSSAIVAYGFARFRFPGRGVLFLLLLATLMVPRQALTIALFLTFKNLRWLNTYLPLLVPKLFGSAFDIFLFRQFFLGLSHELDEAARLDGCGSWAIFWRIILPQSTPVLIVVAFFAFLGSWRDTWGPLLYLNDDSLRTLPLGLLYFVGPYGILYPQLMAATVLTLIVPIMVYAVAQRYIDRGVVIARL